MSMTYAEVNAGEAIVEISQSVLRLCGEIMERHGNDPLAMAIVAGGLAMTINDITRHLDPSFAAMVMAAVKTT